MSTFPVNVLRIVYGFKQGTYITDSWPATVVVIYMSDIMAILFLTKQQPCPDFPLFSDVSASQVLGLSVFFSKSLLCGVCASFRRVAQRHVISLDALFLCRVLL